EFPDVVHIVRGEPAQEQPWCLQVAVHPRTLSRCISPREAAEHPTRSVLPFRLRFLSTMRLPMEKKGRQPIRVKAGEPLSLTRFVPPWYDSGTFSPVEYKYRAVITLHTGDVWPPIPVRDAAPCGG